MSTGAQIAIAVAAIVNGWAVETVTTVIRTITGG